MVEILQEIVKVKRQEVERLKADAPICGLEVSIDRQAHPLNLAGALMGDSVRIIAEVKKASPTKGLFRDNFDPTNLATTYADNGAAAVSVLTNSDHFLGNIEHLASVHGAVNQAGIPVLRKDFIFDPYQVYEARAYGADAVLLIVAMLTPELLSDLLNLCKKFWMQCLVEVHDEAELDIALDSGAEIVGINNRDLRTFKTSLEVTERLAPLVPRDKIVVSESGISNRQHIHRLREAGVHAALVGEALLTAPDVSIKLRELV